MKTEHTEANTATAPSVGSIAMFGGLLFCGCSQHTHRTDLSCCKIRRQDGSALSAAETWAVIVQMGSYISALEEECDCIGLQKAQHAAGLSLPNT